MAERQSKFLGPIRRLLKRRKEAKKPPRFSTMLRLLAEEPTERIAISTIAEVFGDRAFGALMFVFAAPNLLPLPPGVSAVLGAPLILIAGQLALGRRTIWLPDALADRSISRADYRRMVARLLPRLRWTERLLSPRLGLLLKFPADRLIGAACFLLAVILFLPIPLGNMLPALAITLFSLALIQLDGVAALLGWVAAAVSISLIVAISGALWAGFTAFVEALLRLVQ